LLAKGRHLGWTIAQTAPYFLRAPLSGCSLTLAELHRPIGLIRHFRLFRLAGASLPTARHDFSD
jgi:hypothetical protein